MDVEHAALSLEQELSSNSSNIWNRNTSKKHQQNHVVVVPGEEVTIEQGYLRGHGTYVRMPTESDENMKDEEQNGSELVASVAGVVERVNKLISVRPLRARYSGEVGDVIVGRIVEVGPKRWRVNVNARQDAVLMLGSVNLPGGAQRRRTLEDQLQMRQLFQERDLISAEVAKFYDDGSMSIQTRSLKYGKLENGSLVSVPCALIKRLKQHFVNLDCGIDLILGHNGNIWITETPPDISTDKDDVGDIHHRGRLAETIEKQKQFNATRIIRAEAREKISRVRNTIVILANAYNAIHPKLIMQLYSASLENGLTAKDILVPDVAQSLISTI